MRVLLLRDVPGLGAAGDVVEAAAGHACNHLFPAGRAVRATPDRVARGAALLAKMAARDADLAAGREEAHAGLRALPGPLRVGAKAGPGGKLFGAVNRRVVAEAIHDATGLAVDRGHISITVPIKSVGAHTVAVALPGLEPLEVEIEVTG